MKILQITLLLGGPDPLASYAPAFIHEGSYPEQLDEEKLSGKTRFTRKTVIKTMVAVTARTQCNPHRQLEAKNFATQIRQVAAKGHSGVEVIEMAVGWLVERLSSPVSTKIGYIWDKVLGGDLVPPG